MSSETTKPLVLVIGGTGNTGQSVIGSLLESGTFRVATLTRYASRSKPAVEALRSRGVEVRFGDFGHDSPGQLQSTLAGVDVILSLVSAEAILEQKNVLKAAKRAGVKRIIPCDFGTACPPGRRALHDDKLAIRSYVRELGVPYTFINVGWWMQLILPHPIGSPAGWVAQISHEFFGPGNIKTTVTSLADIGSFVVRIITDPRTINKYVFCWGEEVTLDEVYTMAERISGQKLSDLKVQVTEEEVLRRAATAKADYIHERTTKVHAEWAFNEYAYSIYFCGDNTLEKAKADGAIDARELYPEFKPATLEQCAKEFYAQVPQYMI